MKREVKPARSVWHKPALPLPCPVVTGPLPSSPVSILDAGFTRSSVAAFGVKIGYL